MYYTRSCRTVVAACIVAVLFFFLLQFIAKQRAIAERSAAFGHLSQVSFIVKNYEFANGRLPPAFTKSNDGSRLHSWRVVALLGPPLDDPPIGFQTDEAWNSEANQKAADRNRDYAGYFTNSRGDDNIAEILAVIGANSLWDSASGQPNGTMSSMPDTVMLVALPTSDVHWTEPRDITESELLALLDTGATIPCISASGQYGTLGVQNNVLRVVPPSE